MPGETQSVERHYDRTGRLFIIGALALALWFSWKVFRSFFSAIAIAAVLDVVCYPVFARIARVLGGRRMPAAGLTVFLVLLCVILPMVGIGVLVTKQALDLYQGVSVKAQGGAFDGLLRFREWGAVEAWLAEHAPWLDTQALNLKVVFLNFLQKISGYGVALGTAAASNALAAAGTFAVVLFTFFFMLLDGAGFARWAWSMVPLNCQHRRVVTRTFIEITKSAVLGSGLIAIIQGFLGGVAFWIAGLPGVLWGFIMAFTSLVPVVGAAIIWVPGALLLLAQGHVGYGLFLLVWGTVVISGVDNVIRMFVVTGPVRMHPLLIFFSVVGGIKVSGLLGVVFGPLALAMVQTLLEIYRGEFMVPPAPAGDPAPGGEAPAVVPGER